MSDSGRNDKPGRHPVSVAFESLRQTQPTLFEGSASGTYLSNRLELAFQQGWIACERTVKNAMDGKLCDR